MGGMGNGMAALAGFDDRRQRLVLGGGWQMVERVSGTCSLDTNMGMSPTRDATKLRHA